MSKAMGFYKAGGPEALQLIDRDTPEPGPGQVRIAVRAAGVQPFDTAIVAGWAPPGVGELPRVPGNEFAGLVEALGEGVDGVRVGDEVLGFGFLGAYAEHLVIAADQVTTKPATMPWEVAGGLTAGAQTASIALEMLAIRPGEVVLVTGAAGSVGGFAVQLARRSGARVIGAARANHHDYLRSLGAEPVATDEDFVDRVRALTPNGVDAVIDGVGGHVLDQALELVGERQRVITLVEHERAAELGARVTVNLRSAERLAELAALYEKGELKSWIREAFPLEQAGDALRALQAGGGGKIVLTVAG